MDELEALKAIDGAFSSLDTPARVRAIKWIVAKYELEVGREEALVPTERTSAAPTTRIAMTAKAVATTLGANTGTDLVQSSALYLTRVAEKETFSRQELLDAMKSATGFFKPTYRGNLSSYLETLCRKNVLIEVSAETYTLKAGALAQLSQKLQSNG